MKWIVVVLMSLVCSSGYAATWTGCAAEGATCSFTGTRNVRYGTTSQYITKSATQQISCTAAAFGADPASGQTKSCSYSSVVTGESGAGCGTGTANPNCIGTLPVTNTSSGLTLQSGQTYSGAHYTSTTGPCLIVPAGASNITIRDNEIGPCGANGDINTYGVRIDSNATNITIQRNYIHDISTGVFAGSARHPIIFDRNYTTNIRGPFYRGQMIQFDGVNTGTSRSKITCNVSDVQGATYRNVEDHISMYNSAGLPADRTEIAYNKVRGGSPTSNSGSGINVGDYGGGYAYIHHNIVVNIGNVGIGISGGVGSTSDNNRVYNDGVTSRSGVGMSVTRFDSQFACSGNAVTNNKSYSIDVVWNAGVQNPYWDSGACGAVTLSGNTFPDNSLSASIFNESITECQ